MTTRACSRRHKAAFLAAYEQSGNIARSSRDSGVSVRSVHDWRHRDPDFAKRVLDIGIKHVHRQMELSAPNGPKKLPLPPCPCGDPIHLFTNEELIRRLRNRLPPGRRRSIGWNDGWYSFRLPSLSPRRRTPEVPLTEEDYARLGIPGPLPGMREYRVRDYVLKNGTHYTDVTWSTGCPWLQELNKLGERPDLMGTGPDLMGSGDFYRLEDRIARLDRPPLVFGEDDEEQDEEEDQEPAEEETQPEEPEAREGRRSEQASESDPDQSVAEEPVPAESTSDDVPVEELHDGLTARQIAALERVITEQLARLREARLQTDRLAADMGITLRGPPLSPDWYSSRGDTS